MKASKYQVLEENQRFSQSLLWELQADYFRSEGIDAWRSGAVPSYISSNPIMARTYAEIIFAGFRDLDRGNASPDCIYILELGAGTGQLGFLVLKALEKLCSRAAFEVPDYCYVLSDISEDNLAFWQAHPRLAPFLKAGKLDIAHFDARSASPLQLLNSGQVLDDMSLNGPLFVLANYFFDGIPMDLYHVQKEQVFETKITLGIKPGKGKREPEIKLEKLKTRFEDHPIKNPAYPETFLNDILENYRQSLLDAHILLPVSGIRCIERLRKLSKAGLILLSSDKGRHELRDLEGKRTPSLVMHGSFSLTVNYHAIREYCKSQGGWTLKPERMHYHLDTLAFNFAGEVENWLELKSAFEDRVKGFGPDEFFNFKRLIEEDKLSLNYLQVFAFIVLSDYDQEIFENLLPTIMGFLLRLDLKQKNELVRLLEKIWEKYYPIGADFDMAFSFGKILLGIDFFEQALFWFERSIRTYGGDFATDLNCALCLHGMGDDQEAMRLVSRVLEDDPKNEKALALVETFRL